MKIYFSGSISGGRYFLNSYKQIVCHLKQAGHQVLSEHIVQDNVLDLENQHSPQQIYERDIEFLNACDAVIAEVSNPSLGVGYELCYAVAHDIPALCLYQPGIFVSRMIIGNTSPRIATTEYGTEDELYAAIDEFLREQQ